jgi:thiosulfate dehydrogenase
MVPPSFRGLLLGFICSFALVAGADVRAAGSAVPDAAAADARAQLPSGPEGELIRYGRDLITHTRKYASKYVKAGMDCSACHIDAGTKPRGGSLLGIYAKFPQWNQRAKRFIALQDRLQECFLYSENGYAPPANSREIIAMTAYIAWLSRGAPVGQGFPNQGFVTVHAAAPPNKAAGAKIFAAKCAACHGADGQGNDSAGFPPLWGPKSFNSGAGMNTKMPAFVKANMPPTAPGSLTDQEAVDVSAYVLSHPRPKFDPNRVISFPSEPAKFF